VLKSEKSVVQKGSSDIFTTKTHKTMAKLKIGDRVRNVGCTDDSYVKIGAIGSIAHQVGDSLFIEWDDEKDVGPLWRKYMVKNGGVGICVDADFLELVTEENYDPQEQQKVSDDGFKKAFKDAFHNTPLQFVPSPQPLTKREQFAMAAMQGLLARGSIESSMVTKRAVHYADQLLADLERIK
jgi:hypothetical protein